MSDFVGPWICDVCGESIDNPKNGYVIWKKNQDMEGMSFKIIHNGKCDQEDHGSSTALPNFLGNEGLTKLLSMLSLGVVLINQGVESRQKVENIDEFVDLIRRLQTPNYEQARKHFSNYEVLEDLQEANEVFPYTQETLKSIVERHG
jgi:hypothetical protein